MRTGRKAVAIVDDDPAVLDATSCFVDSLGYVALPFKSGEDFLEFGGKNEVSHLLTDVNMPGMSGLDLNDIVRARFPDVVVIMMTALRDEKLRARALAGGARELLRKPLLADDLIRCLDDDTSH